MAHTVCTSGLYAQSVFNVLDSSSFGIGGIIHVDDQVICSGAAYNASGTGTVVLTKYNASNGSLNLVDSFSTDGIATYNGLIRSFPGDSSRIVLLSSIDTVPPYTQLTADLQLTFMDTNFTGQEIHTYGGSNFEVALEFLDYKDHIFILGSTQSYGNGLIDYYLQKTDTLGNEIWHQTYGSSEKEDSRSITVTQDSNLLLLGIRRVVSPNFDLYMVKVNPDSGQVIWEKQYGGPYNDYTGRIISLHEHSFIVYHNIDDGVNTVAYIDKLDGNGDVIWSKAFPNGSYSSFDFTKPIENDDGTIMVQYQTFNSQNKVISKLLKLDPNGEIIWSKDYFTRPDKSQYIYDMEPAQGGGYFLGGSAFPVGINTQYGWLMRVNCLGEDGTQYPVSGAPCDQYDCTLYPIDASFTPNTTYIDLGIESGEVSFENNSANTTSRVWHFGDGVTDYTDSIITHTYTQPGIYEVELIVFHGMCSDTVTQTIEVVNTAGILSPNLDYGVSVYPNPSKGNFVITFKHAPEGSFEIVDLAGRVHRSEELNGALKYPVEGLGSGVYLVQVHYPSGVSETKRVVVE